MQALVSSYVQLEHGYTVYSVVQVGSNFNVFINQGSCEAPILRVLKTTQ